MICTSGYLRMEIICDMPESMVLQIVSKMYGGGLPPDEQIPLYIKEYINIVCGHGVSSLNNTLKKFRAYQCRFIKVRFGMKML